jgi:4'-phosphopantetheinyl transferase
VEVGLWLGSVGELLADAAGSPRLWCSLSEQARRDAIAHPQRRDQFMAGRWGLRCLLSTALGGAAADWVLEASPDAAPSVSSGPSHFQGRLSLAHSGDLVLCAMAEGELGVDLERGDRRLHDPDAWLDFACTPAERSDCLAQAGPLRLRRMLMHWTAKEAFGKARGTGLPFEALRRIEALPAEGEANNTWIGAGDAAVIAVHTPSGPPSLRWFGGVHQAQALAWSRWQVTELSSA